MSEITTVGLDLTKNVFQMPGADRSERAVLRKKLGWEQVLDFLRCLPKCVVAMEVCATSHHWGRVAQQHGHEIRLVPVAYVKIP